MNITRVKRHEAWGSWNQEEEEEIKTQNITRVKKQSLYFIQISQTLENSNSDEVQKTWNIMKLRKLKAHESWGDRPKVEKN